MNAPKLRPEAIPQRDALSAYYAALPFDVVMRWLRNGEHDGMDCTHLREFAFIYWSKKKAKTAMGRHKFFDDYTELRDAAINEAPQRIEVGAVFERARVGGQSARVMRRELLFDIDMDDYDDVRSCCKNASMCARCLPLAVECGRRVESFLRTHLNYRDITWIYSGRRGVHCWVRDAEALTLTKDARAAALVYLRKHFNDDQLLRLDGAVTTTPTHLCKMPMCVHPSTQRLCVPIDDLATFDIDAVPTLTQALNDNQIVARYADKLN